MQYHLDQCVWEITLACCFSCKYCGSRGGKARENELSTEECLRVADELSGLHVRRVSMIGGEVFLRPDWEQIVSRLTGHGIAVNIITNGFLFTEGLIEKLKSCRVESVAVSIDGPEKVHDKYRQNGSYARALSAVRTLTKAGIPVSVISTLNAENAETLPELYETLLSYPIFAWQLQACSPMGNAALSGIDYAFSPLRVVRFVETHKDTAPFLLGIADNIGYFTPSEGTLRGAENAYFRGCSAGIRSIGIDSAGNVRGCESMYDPFFIEGNLREKKLREIWEDPEAFSYNRKFSETFLTGACRTCPAGPYCAGGCRSYNFFTHGKLYEAPRCAGLEADAESGN